MSGAVVVLLLVVLAVQAVTLGVLLVVAVDLHRVGRAVAALVRVLAEATQVAQAQETASRPAAQDQTAAEAARGVLRL